MEKINELFVKYGIDNPNTRLLIAFGVGVLTGWIIL